MRVLVGAPTYNGRVFGQYTRSMLELFPALGSDMAWESTKAVMVSTARNLLASRGLENEPYTHLLFVDADLVSPPSWSRG